MKTKITTLVLCLVLSLTTMAQRKTDAFFSSFDNNPRASSYIPIRMDEFSFESMSVYEQEVPIDNGVLVLVFFAVVYIVYRIIFKLKEA